MKLKIALAMVVLLLLAAGIGGYYFLTSLNGLVASGIERYGSEIMGTAVRVQSVRIDLREGRGAIHGLTVANPPGFSSKYAFQLGEIRLDIDSATVLRSPVVIEEIHIGRPEIQFEVAANTKSNFDVLVSNIKRYQASGGAAVEGGEKGAAKGASQGPGSADDAGGDLLLAVRRFTFEEAAIKADARAVAGDQGLIELPMPPLTLSNPGGKAGAPAAEIGAEVMSVYSTKVLKAVAREVLKGRAGEWLDDQGDAGKAVKGLLNQILK